MRIVDTKGMLCPAPLIATKRALKEIQVAESLQVLTDNQTSLNNLMRFLKDNKTEFKIEADGEGWALTIIKGKVEEVKIRTEDYCTPEIPHFSKGNFVIAFSSDKMGEGDYELGNLLMTNFIKAVKDLDELPGKIVFYNKGVSLGSDDSMVLEHLREIEKMGVELLFCATCVKYYSLEEKVKIGSLSNMFEIAQVMALAGNVIKP